jgi:hypothetical protein
VSIAAECRVNVALVDPVQVDGSVVAMLAGVGVDVIALAPKPGLSHSSCEPSRVALFRIGVASERTHESSAIAGLQDRAWIG